MSSKEQEAKLGAALGCPCYFDKIPEIFEPDKRDIFTNFCKKLVDGLEEYLNSGHTEKLFSISNVSDADEFKCLITSAWGQKEGLQKKWNFYADEDKKIDVYFNAKRAEVDLNNQVMCGIIITGWLFGHTGGLSKSSPRLLTSSSTLTTFNTEIFVSYDTNRGFYLIAKFNPFKMSSE